VLHDRLRWLVTAGAGLRALTAAALAHALSAAAAMGQPGEAAGGSAAALDTAAGAGGSGQGGSSEGGSSEGGSSEGGSSSGGVGGGLKRAPLEELLEPFPAHVLVSWVVARRVTDSALACQSRPGAALAPHMWPTSVRAILAHAACVINRRTCAASTCPPCPSWC
jgi:hypothetical protein